MLYLLHDLILVAWALIGAISGYLMVQGFKAHV